MWIIKCLKICKISDKIVNFITNASEKKRVELKVGGQTLAEVKVQRDIFQGDLTLIFYSKAKMPLNKILSSCTASNKFSKLQER